MAKKIKDEFGKRLVEKDEDINHMKKRTEYNRDSLNYVQKQLERATVISSWLKPGLFFEIIRLDTVYEGVYNRDTFETDRMTYAFSSNVNKYMAYKSNLNIPYQKNPIYEKLINSDFSIIFRIQNRSIRRNKSKSKNPYEGRVGEMLVSFYVPKRETTNFRFDLDQIEFGDNLIRFESPGSYNNPDVCIEIHWNNDHDQYLVLKYDAFCFVYNIQEILELFTNYDRLFNYPKEVLKGKPMDLESSKTKTIEYFLPTGEQNTYVPAVKEELKEEKEDIQTEREMDSDDPTIEEEKTQYAVLKIDDPNAFYDDMEISENIVEGADEVLELALLKSTYDENVYEPKIIKIDKREDKKEVINDPRDMRVLHTDPNTYKIEDGFLKFTAYADKKSKRGTREVNYGINLEDEKESDIKLQVCDKNNIYQPRTVFFDYRTGYNKKIHYKPIETIDKARNLEDDIIERKGLIDIEDKVYQFTLVRQGDDIALRKRKHLKREDNVRNKDWVDKPRWKTDEPSGFSTLVCKELTIKLMEEKIEFIIKEVTKGNYRKEFSCTYEEVIASYFEPDQILDCGIMEMYIKPDKNKKRHILYVLLKEPFDIVDDEYVAI